MNRNLGAIFLLFGVLSSMQIAGQTRRALLIGINTYQPARTQTVHPAGCVYDRCELGTFPNLNGSVISFLRMRSSPEEVTK